MATTPRFRPASASVSPRTLAPALGLALAGAVGAGACSTLGNAFQPDAVDTVGNGMTRAQVVALLGSEPTYVSTGGHRMDWDYADLVLTNTYRHHVSFLFDDGGRTYGIPDGGILGPHRAEYARAVGPQG